MPSTKPITNPDREYHRNYQREWIARRRREWFEKNGPCVLCDSTEDLQIDHVDPTKKVSHRVWSWAERRRNRELAKCQVLCGACHLAKTSAAREPPHGTHARYVKRACRCAACRAAHSATNRRYR